MLEKTFDLASVQQTIRKSVSRIELESWTSPKVRRVYRDLIWDWLGILLTLLAVSWMSTWWMYGMAFLVIGFCQYRLYILGHDALHQTLHPNRIINDRLSKWLIHGPLFLCLEDARHTHLEHHRRLGTEADPDRSIHSLENKRTRILFLLFCTGLATFGKVLLRVTPLGSLTTQRPETKSDRIELEQPETSSIAILASYVKKRLSVIVMQTLLLALFDLLSLPLWSYLILG
jgi:fatty acid desaturase